MSWQNHLSPLSPQYWPFSLDWLPSTACLVGGAVRDALLNRQKDYLDLDFVLPELAVETARKIAHYYQAGFVVLDQKRQIARVVFEEGTVDFAQQEGDQLETDLRRRDFTINAIAYNPFYAQLIDPLHGLADLEQKRLRMVSQANLEDDPLRLLRAYRQAAQLNFKIEPTTRKSIRLLAPLLGKIAAERVQAELDYLLANLQGNYWLIEAWEDGLFKPWLKNATAQKVQQVVKVDESARFIEEIIAKNGLEPFIPFAKLASLVSSVPAEAELELVRLKYSRTILRTVTTALKSLSQLQKIIPPISLREQYFFFLEMGDVFPVLALLAVTVGINHEIIIPLIERYFNSQDQVAHPTSLVTGHDLIRGLNIPPSPKIGQLLTEIQVARIEGKISTIDEALEFAKNYMTRQN